MEKTGKKTEKTKKTKERKRAGWILTPVLVLVLAAAICVGTGIWKEYRDSVIDTQKQQMLLTVQSLGDSMEVSLRDYVEDLEGLYRMAVQERLFGEEPAGDQGHFLTEYVDSHQTMVWDVMVEDERGRVLESVRHLHLQQVYSISRIDSGRSLRMAEMDDGEKYLILRMEIPGDGAISLLLDLEQYYQAMMQRLQVGTNGYMVLKDRNGIILMHPERAQWGIEVIHGRMEMYEGVDLESLRIMTDHQKEGREGVEEYDSYWWTEEGYPRVRKISAYCPVQLGEDFLILSAVMDYNDIYIPVARGVLRLLVLFMVFFLVMAAMAVYMVHMMLQQQRDTEQIAYLTELNRLLEEMHRSEETIAHQQRLQIMGTMTGGIAHEFNNLLTPIMGYADLLMMELEEDSESYDNALEIYEASAKAKEIIQQISSLSRKNMETAYKNTDAARMLTRALKMVRSVCPSHVVLSEEIRLDGAYILCNETQMNQVILNICVNAIHAIGHKEGRILIHAKVCGRQELADLDQENLHLSPVSDNWDHYVCIEIRDNGCGMSREVMNQIFDPFFTTKKGGKGTGLGLALVEQIISSHRGGLYVESEPGKGTAFSVYLPVNGQGTEQRAGIEDGNFRTFQGTGFLAGPGPEQAPRLGFLVVDDNPKVLQLLKKDADRCSIAMECQMGFEDARQLLEGTEGTQRQEKGAPFDALVTEQEIGGESAVDFCMAVRGRYPDMTIIVMADQVTRELVEARQRGILDGCIQKPVSISMILEALKSVGV